MIEIKKSISNRVVVILITSIVIVTTILATYLYWHEKGEKESEIKKSSEEAVERISSNLAYPLWSYDDKQLERTVVSEMANQNIKAVIVKRREHGSGFEFKIGKKKDRLGNISGLDKTKMEKSLLSLEKDIEYRGSIAGKVEIFVTDYYLKQYLQDLVTRILLQTVILSCIIIAVVFLSLKRIILNPLLVLQNAVKKYRELNYIGEIPVASEDEIGKLATVFNAMAREQVEAKDGLQKAHDKLEERVKQRTSELEIQAKRQKVLIDLAQTITSAIQLEENEILELIYQNATELMDTKNMYIALYNETEDFVRFPLSFIDGKPIHIESRKAGKGLTEEIIKTKEPIFFRTKRENEEWFAQPGRKDYMKGQYLFSSWIGVPMMKGENVAGVIVNYHKTKDNIYSQDDFEIIKAMSDLAAIAFDNSRLYFEKDQQTHALEKANLLIAETQDILTRTGIASDFVHRINNLAGTIPLYTQMIRKELDARDARDEKISEFTNKIDKDTKGLLNKAAQLQTSPQTEEINVTESLDILLRQIEIQYADKNKICVQIDFSSDLYLVNAIYSNLEDAIWNVMVNAIEAMPDGGSLNISASNSEAENKKWVKILIEDEGQGISPKNQEKIFRAFYSTKKRGRGYGLWRSKNIIENLGGHIYVKSELGKGSMFTIMLPAVTRDRRRVSNNDVQ